MYVPKINKKTKAIAIRTDGKNWNTEKRLNALQIPNNKTLEGKDFHLATNDQKKEAKKCVRRNKNKNPRKRQAS